MAPEEELGYHKPEDKNIVPGTELPDADPEYMTLEDDGQEEFDRMWEEGSTVTPTGYID